MDINPIAIPAAKIVGIAHAIITSEPNPHMTYKLKSLLAVAVAAGLSVSAYASPVVPTSNNLLSLSQGGTIAIGDKIFSGFSFQATALTSFDPSTIMVSASIDPVGGYYLLTYSGNISFGNPSATFATADLLLNYTVTATAGTIDMIDQFYTGGVSPINPLLTDSGAISVAETVRSGVVVIASSNLDIFDKSDPFAEAGDNLFLPAGITTASVTKDISFGAANALVTISTVTQSFHQVPDGGSAVMLLGMALVGVETLRRKLKA